MNSVFEYINNNIEVIGICLALIFFTLLFALWKDETRRDQ